MQIAKIIHNSYVDGPGERAVLFMQGCSIRCIGCQSPHLQATEGGTHYEVNIAFAYEFVRQARAKQGLAHPLVTISGGEPFDQANDLSELVFLLRDQKVGHIVVYTGYRYEDLNIMGKGQDWLSTVLSRLDVLVDGPYQMEHGAPGMQYRGSRNQRAIDMPATLKKGEVVTLDWNRPEWVIKPNGNIIAPAPLARRLSQLGVGAMVATRRCGEV